MKNPEKFKIRLEWNVQDVLAELSIMKDNGECEDYQKLNTDECITVLKNIEQKYTKIYGLKCIDLSYEIRQLIHDHGEFATLHNAIKHLMKKTTE